MFPNGGSGGDAGSGGANTAGSGGTTAGTGGDAGSGGLAGEGGSSGSAGSAGNAGSAGAGDGGSSGGGSGGSGGSGGAGGELSFDEFCSQAKDVSCAWLERCGGPKAECDAWWGFQQISKTCNFAPEAIAKQRITFNGHAALRCVTEAASESCDTDLSLLLPARACQDVLVGLQRLDDDCYAESNHLTDECAEGYCIAQESCPSTCTPYAEVSDSCPFDADVRCNPATTFCNGQLQCELLKTPGEPCQTGECEPGLVCVNIPQSAVCAEPIAPGEKCEFALQCTGNHVCKDEVCVKEVAAGDVCASDANCPTGYGCYIAEDSYLATCRKLPKEGEPCDENVCGPGLFCNAEKCQRFGESGADCSLVPCAEAFWCKELDGAHTCEANGGENDACTDVQLYPNGRRCQDGLYCVPTALDAEQVPSAYACRSPGAVDDLCNLGESLSCQTGLRCARETARCAPPGEEGGTCHPLWPLVSCEPGLYCDCRAEGCPVPSHVPNTDDVCVKQLENEAACEAHHECLSNNCANFVCADPEDPLTSGCTSAATP